MAKIVCLGEGMLELSRQGDAWKMGFGGDTLNTAIHLARAGHAVSYMTALGADPFSDTLRQQWHTEGLDQNLILTHPARQAGLYAITNDTAGERSFTYWRENSAARAMFELAEMAPAADRAEGADLFYFSLISLAVLPVQGRNDLLRLADRVRQRGGLVAFDGNYRARLWEDDQAARSWRDKAIALASIGLPTFEDEAALSGEAAPTAVAEHWKSLGCREVIVKLGAQGCLLPDLAECPVPKRLEPIDTSGAGDAFNAGYLSARLGDAAPDAAALQGHALAGWTVMRRGAIPPRDGTAPY